MKRFVLCAVGASALCSVFSCGPFGPFGPIPLTCLDGGTSPTDPNAACNSIAFGSSPTIETMEVAADVPALTGGTLVNGTYYMTERTNYTGVGGSAGPTGQKSRQIYTFDNGTVNSASFDPSQCSIDRQTGTATPSGSQLTYTPTCGCTGGSCGGTANFTATSTTFTLQSGGNTVQVTTKQ